MLRAILFSLVAAVLFCCEVKAMPTDIKSFLDDKTNSLNEDGFLPETPPQMLSFARYVVGNWQQLLTTIGTDAPDVRRQNLIVVAAEFLPPHDYVSFVSGICDLNASGKIKLGTFKTILNAKMFKNGFLAFNYDKPEVAAVITKLETILQAGEPGKWTDCFSGIKSGTAKQAVVAERTRDNEPLPEAIDAGGEAYRQLMGGQ